MRSCNQPEWERCITTKRHQGYLTRMYSSICGSGSAIVDAETKHSTNKANEREARKLF